MKKGLVKKNRKGFTLIELVVVIAILGILAAILIPVIGGFIESATEAKDEANAKNLYNCVAMALATGNNVASFDQDDTFPASVEALFGPAPTDDYSVTISGDPAVVTSVTVGTGTYAR